MMIRYDELVITCPECKGEGGGTTESGNSMMRTYTPWICSRCDGAKEVLTEQGRELARFIERLRYSPRLR